MFLIGGTVLLIGASVLQLRGVPQGGFLGTVGMVLICFGVAWVAGIYKFSPGLTIAFLVGMFIPIVGQVVLIALLPRMFGTLRSSGYRVNAVGQVTRAPTA